MSDIDQEAIIQGKVNEKAAAILDFIPCPLHAAGDVCQHVLAVSAFSQAVAEMVVWKLGRSEDIGVNTSIEHIPERDV